MTDVQDQEPERGLLSKLNDATVLELPLGGNGGGGHWDDEIELNSTDTTDSANLRWQVVLSLPQYAAFLRSAD